MATVNLIGNVGKDPELKYLSSKNGDFAVTRFSVAETERVKQGDNWIDGDTVWYSVSATGKLAETLIDTINKGMKVLVQGNLKQFEYEKDGEKKSGFEVRATSVTIVPTATKISKKAEASEEWPF